MGLATKKRLRGTNFSRSFFIESATAFAPAVTRRIKKLAPAVTRRTKTLAPAVENPCSSQSCMKPLLEVFHGVIEVSYFVTDFNLPKILKLLNQRY